MEDYKQLLEKTFSRSNTITSDYTDYVKSNCDMNFKFITRQERFNKNEIYLGCEDTGEQVLICVLTNENTQENYDKLTNILGLLNY